MRDNGKNVNVKPLIKIKQQIIRRKVNLHLPTLSKHYNNHFYKKNTNDGKKCIPNEIRNPSSLPEATFPTDANIAFSCSWVKVTVESWFLLLFFPKVSLFLLIKFLAGFLGFSSAGGSTGWRILSGSACKSVGYCLILYLWSLVLYPNYKKIKISHRQYKNFSSTVLFLEKTGI